MNLFIICFILAALLYVLTLPFVGQRAKKTHTEEVPTRVYSEHFPYEEKTNSVQSYARVTRRCDLRIEIFKKEI